MATAVASLDFDGSGDVVDYTGTNSSGSNLNITAVPFTLMAWTNSDSTTGTIIGKRDGGSVQYQLYINVGTSLTLFSGGGQSSRSISGSWETLGWVHIAATMIAPSTTELYENATSLGTPIAAGVPTYQNVNVSAGARWNGYPTTAFEMNGRMAHMMIWTGTALSASQITEVMWNPGSIAGGGLWSTMLDGGSTVYDRSGNGNDGTIANATKSTDGPPVFLWGVA